MRSELEYFLTQECRLPGQGPVASLIHVSVFCRSGFLPHFASALFPFAPPLGLWCHFRVGSTSTSTSASKLDHQIPRVTERSSRSAHVLLHRPCSSIDRQTVAFAACVCFSPFPIALLPPTPDVR